MFKRIKARYAAYAAIMFLSGMLLGFLLWPVFHNDHFTVKIPSGLGKIHTYEGWQCITAPSSAQYRLRAEAGMNFNPEGFGVINGRYVIACTDTFGKVGDRVDFYKANGNIIRCIIGDIKSPAGAGNKWGSCNGQNIIEFIVDRDSWYPESRSTGKPHMAPGNAEFHPEWNSETVKAVNYGGYEK